MTTLRHGDILIRPYARDDADALYQQVCASRAVLSRWLPWCHAAYSQADAQAWIAHCMDSWERRSEFPFGIFAADGGTLLGGVGLSEISRAHNMANIGYWVGTAQQGRGIATRAAARVAYFGFDEARFSRLEIVVAEENRASRRVAEKLGAHLEAVARHRILLHGVPASAAVYSLIPSDVLAGEAT